MPKSIGEALKDARTNAGLTVQEVSDRLICSGFEKALPKTIYSWESGNSKPSTDYFLELCVIYGIKDPTSYFGYKKSPETSGEVPGEKVRYEDVCLALKELGIIKNDKSLTRKDIDFIKAILLLLKQWFEG